MTIQDFIAEQGLRMDAQPVPTNPNMIEHNDDRGPAKGTQHYLVTLTSPHFTIHTFYSVGPGVVDNWLRGKLPKNHVWVKAPCSVNGDAYRNQGEAAPGHSVVSYHMEVKPQDFRPELVDVLDCLASDAASVENCRMFEDWANEMGYDEDSRSAERTYQICEKQSKDLRFLLGSRKVFEALLFEIERL